MSVTIDQDGLPDGVLRMRLHGGRANALVPDFMAALHEAWDQVEARAPAAVLMTGGANFCSGGDIGGFHSGAQDRRLVEYAKALVPALQAFVQRLIAAPFIVAAAARGAITGGGAGLLFASDMAVVGRDAFVQPYYNVVGFGPDGGWCAILPERIGLAPAQAWLAENRRIGADGLCDLGLALGTSDTPEDALIDRLAATDLGTLATAKATFWDAARRDLVAQRLEAETQGFLTRIAAPDMPDRLSQFLQSMKKEVRHV